MTFERCSKKHDINPVVYQSIGGNDRKQSVKQFCCISFYDESKKITKEILGRDTWNPLNAFAASATDTFEKLLEPM